jgi:hypothetical protein
MESLDMLRHSTLLIFAAIIMTAVPARGQAPRRLPVTTPSGQGAPIVRPGQPPPGGITRPVVPGAGTMSLELESVDVGKPVLNAPYSAEAVTEVIQTLADGNRIEQRTSAIVARDGRGRTRREQHGIALGALVAQVDSPIVTITDPTTGTHVNLNQDSKIAFRSQSIGSFPPPALPSGAGIQTGTDDPGFAARESPPEVRTKKLGTKEIEGVRVEGTETTVTIRAGAMGNRLPIRLVSERWYSPELKVVVMTRRIDPRFGETRFHLTNIVRDEPPAHLFEVPADFRIEDRLRSPAQPIRRDEG